MPEHRLILIGGPIASGKTVAARGLAARLRSLGQDVAAIDMDEMIAIVAGEDWSLITASDRQKACRLTSRVVQGLFDEGVGTVAIAGSTLSPYEWNEVATHLAPAPTVTRVLLRVSVEESIRRAQIDPARTSTPEPGYVEKLAAAIDWARVPTPDIDLQTDAMTIDEVLASISSVLSPPLPQRERRLGGEV